MNGSTWRVDDTQDKIQEYIHDRNFEALFDVWYHTTHFGMKNKPLFQCGTFANWYRGGIPNLRVSACFQCNNWWPLRSVTHTKEYPYCVLNQFLTFERFRPEKLPNHLPPAQRLYVLKTRFSNYLQGSCCVDTIFNRGLRSPDPDYDNPHQLNWPPGPTELPVEYFRDALIDEAYLLRPGTAFQIHKQFLELMIQQQKLPPETITQTYPKFLSKN